MSCGKPHETDCSEVLDHLYEYLDQEMPAPTREKYRQHFEECAPCLDKYGLEQAVKKLVKRCCGHDEVPADLRSKVLDRIERIRSGEALPDQGPPAAADQPANPGAPAPDGTTRDAAEREHG